MKFLGFFDVTKSKKSHALYASFVPPKSPGAEKRRMQGQVQKNFANFFECEKIVRSWQNLTIFTRMQLWSKSRRLVANFSRIFEIFQNF